MNREKAINQVTLVGSGVDLLLTAFKFVAGILGRSAAMVADAIHSLSDLLTDAVVLVFVRISSRHPDSQYEYGYGKFETLATVFIGVALLAVAGGILYHGFEEVVAWFHGENLPKPGSLALWAAVLSIIAKEWLFRHTRKRGRELDSPVVEANAWHHRSDALSSIGTLIGIGGAILLGSRWTVLDPLASIVVGCFIVRIAVKLLHQSFRELMEASLPQETEKEIQEIITSFPDVSDLHNLRTRRIGAHYAIEFHIRMDGHISLIEAHSRAHHIEEALKKRFGAETHIVVHVEPVKPFDKL